MKSRPVHHNESQVATPGWRKGPSILLFTPRWAPFHLPRWQRLKQEPLSAPWPLMQAHSSSATIPCPAPKTCRCSHRYAMELLLHLQSCSTAYQHKTQCYVPLGTAAIHRKLQKFTANSLCALAKMTHSSSHLSWSPWTISASQSKAQSEPCRHFLLPFVYDFQSTALVTSLQWKERKTTMPAAKIILLLITFPVLYLRPIL